MQVSGDLRIICNDGDLTWFYATITGTAPSFTLINWR